MKTQNLVSRRLSVISTALLLLIMASNAPSARADFSNLRVRNDGNADNGSTLPATSVTVSGDLPRDAEFETALDELAKHGLSKKEIVRYGHTTGFYSYSFNNSLNGLAFSVDKSTITLGLGLSYQTSFDAYQRSITFQGDFAKSLFAVLAKVDLHPTTTTIYDIKRTTVKVKNIACTVSDSHFTSQCEINQ